MGLAREGYDVILTDLQSQEAGLRETANLVTSQDRKAYVYPVDVSKKADVDAMVKAALSDAGRIDVLVNNTGIPKLSLLQDLDEATWDAHFNVNVKGVLLMCQAVIPHMRERKSGRVINIASIAGRQGVAMQGGTMRRPNRP
ncbi:MAG: Oxidoreductase, short-chain dehydrogenase/reductase family [uncultured Caballeronia sp.]|nr:MAG: Oxidoreductase, short-chain dehydrogenase/reductase family [uncultured Caballeronia sp.]